MKIQNILGLLIVLFVLISFMPLSYAANYYPVNQLFPEDYSFRSGLAYKIEYFENEIDSFPIKVERKYWNSRYPFENPEDHYMTHLNMSSHNIGFKASIVRNPINTASGYNSGKISYTIALTPFLEATETTIYESPVFTTYKTFASFTEEYDNYGNPVKSVNLGYTGTDTDKVFEPKTYRTYNIRNTIYWDGSNPLSVNSLNTNLQSPPFDPIYKGYTDNYRLDNSETEIIYRYEVDTIPSSSVNSNGDPVLKVEGHLGYYGWTNLPLSTTVKDDYGRLKSKMDLEYAIAESSFEACDNVASHTPLAFCEGANYGDRCIRNSPNKLTISRSNSIKGTDLIVDTKYDDCGNVVRIDLQQSYVHPDDYFRTYYKKTVETEYGGQRVVPNKVITYDLGYPNLKVDNTATHYNNGPTKSVTNERGVTTYYDYDVLGRVIAVWIAPRVKGTDLPNMEYEYYQGVVSDMKCDYEGVSIYEKRIINSNTDYESCYFYDGMGRHIQTQTRDNKGTLDTGDDSVIISGKLIDGMGKLLKSYRTERIYQESPSDLLSYSYAYQNGLLVGDQYPEGFKTITYQEYTYDSLGRMLNVTDTADNSVVSNVYRFESDGGAGSAEYSVVETTDQENKIRTFYNDARGGLVKVSLPTIE